MLLNGKDLFLSSALTLVAPAPLPSLDPGFGPAVLANRAFRREAAVPLAITLERPDGAVSRFDTVAFAEDHPRAAANLSYAERLVKFLLWARGGWKVTVGGPASFADHIRRVYAPDEAPPAQETGQPLGRHLDGCRIGFDLCASDLKVSAVING